MDDKYDLLIGDGSIVRGQKIYNLDDQIKKIIKDFIDQTTIILIEHDELKKVKKALQKK